MLKDRVRARSTSMYVAAISGATCGFDAVAEIVTIP